METLCPHGSADRARQVALCPTLAGVHGIAAELFAADALALAELAALERSYEGELAGEFGVLRYGPAA